MTSAHELRTLVDLLRVTKKIVVITGAGVSTACGIPDFRSTNGLYDKVGELELDQIHDPQEV